MERTLNALDCGRDVWHVRWRYENRRGLLGVEFDRYYKMVTVASFTMALPPVGILWNVFDATLGQGWAEEAEKQHKERGKPWLVEYKYRTSGARDYLLRVLEDETLLDQPIIARLHVSMSGRLSESFSMRLGDLAPLLAYAMREDGFGPLELGPEDYIKVVKPPHSPGSFRAPGVPSGLLEVLQAEAALRSLKGE